MRSGSNIIETINRAREDTGFLSLEETADLATNGNIVFDPFSTLISRDAVIGMRNIFHPNTRLVCHQGAVLKIGSGNILYGNTVIEASTNGVIIGDENQFGDGIVCLKSNTADAHIEVGSNGRYVGVLNLYGRMLLGSGSQILGTITAYDCSLGAGHPHAHPVPDERGAVLKGSGTARRIQLAKGQVIEGWGTFSPKDVANQSSFHPAAAPPCE
ncbi:MAG: AraC family transcriptional regulator [Oricola sp.]